MGDSQTSDSSGPREPRLPREVSASERLREVSFPLAVRGYERAAVDEFVEGVRALVADLEAGQTREGVVQRALDEVGVETAGILQRAHETADRLTAQSRADADDRLRRADSEADQVRREVDDYSEQVVVDTRLLWDERQRLIEDIRQLADEVLATADDAMERLKLPEPLVAAEGDPEPTTAEAAAAGPVGVPAPDPGGVEEEPRVDDTAAWGLGEVEAEPRQGETEGYDPDAYADEPIDAETARYRIGAVEEGELPPDDGAPPADEDSGHTVELEALPGGAGQEAAGGEESAVKGEGSRPDPERDWDRERD
jgi:hypothetical protein